jgi:hypothetical protein
MPETPISDSAARTSSSLNGLMIAVTSFMCELSVGFQCVIYRRGYRGHFQDSRQKDFAAFMPRSGTSING